MTEIITEKNSVSCSDVTILWDEGVSGILSDDQRQDISRHLTDCPQCREFSELTSHLPQLCDTLSDEELESAIQKVSRLARQQRTHHRYSVRWMGISAAAALFLAGVLVMIFIGGKHRQEPTKLQCAPTVPTTLVPGVFMSYCDTNAQPSTQIQTNGDVRVLLPMGTVGLSVDPNRPNKHAVVVETPQGEVHVKGTAFTVQVIQNNTRVEVFRGVVEILPTSTTTIRIHVPEGHGADVSSEHIFPLSPPRTEVFRKKLLALERSHNIDDNQTKEKLSSPLEQSATISNSTVTTGETDKSSPNKSASSASGMHHNGTLQSTTESMYPLIESAQSCLIDHNWKCAAENYREALARFPKRPESLTVRINLAKIELRYLNAPQSALALYQAYQKKAPNGPLAEEALFGIIEAYRKMGQTTKETENLRHFIQQYPNSSHLSNARLRLERLEGMTQ